MKTALKLALCAAVLVAASSAPMANEQALKARQSLMQLYAFNLGGLGAMAKGEVEYDAATATAHGENLLAAAKMSHVGLWPEGSDMDALPGKTEALKVIWTTYPAITEKQKALIAGAEKMAAAAGTGIDGIKGAMGAVGGGCKGCHDTYRKAK